MHIKEVSVELEVTVAFGRVPTITEHGGTPSRARTLFNLAINTAYEYLTYD